MQKLLKTLSNNKNGTFGKMIIVITTKKEIRKERIREKQGNFLKSFKIVFILSRRVFSPFLKMLHLDYHFLEINSFTLSDLIRL